MLSLTSDGHSANVRYAAHLEAALRAESKLGVLHHICDCHTLTWALAPALKMHSALGALHCLAKLLQLVEDSLEIIPCNDVPEDAHQWRQFAERALAGTLLREYKTDIRAEGMQASKERGRAQARAEALAQTLLALDNSDWQREKIQVYVKAAEMTEPLAEARRQHVNKLLGTISEVFELCLPCVPCLTLRIPRRLGGSKNRSPNTVPYTSNVYPLRNP